MIMIKYPYFVSDNLIGTDQLTLEKTGFCLFNEGLKSSSSSSDISIPACSEGLVELAGFVSPSFCSSKYS